ncbi:hypothetical protein Tco_1466726 [Tanacetum coccineum]
MTTLADKAILSGADNHPPILEKDMYNSWKSRMDLYKIDIGQQTNDLESRWKMSIIWLSLQLRNSSNPRQQATINNGRVTLQPIQGRKTSLDVGTSRTYTPGASGSNSGKQRSVISHRKWSVFYMRGTCIFGRSKFQKVKPTDFLYYYAAYQADDWMALTLIVDETQHCQSCSHAILFIMFRCSCELERYKEQVKVLKEEQNVDLRSNNNVSDSCAQSIEIDRLKQTLSESI